MKFPESVFQLICPSPLGSIIIAGAGAQLVGIWFDGQSHQPDCGRWTLAPHNALLQRAQQQLGEYFAAQRQTFELPLDFGSGTVFQQSVWRAMLQVPYGRFCSYSGLSAASGHPGAARAVAAAVGRNPFSIVVPCHRVLGKNGDLTGYAGGLERKTALLQLEGVLN